MILGEILKNVTILQALGYLGSFAATVFLAGWAVAKLICRTGVTAARQNVLFERSRALAFEADLEKCKLHSKRCDENIVQLKGDLATSKKINDALYPVNKVLFCESNPIPIKAAMYLAGLIPALEYRLPLVSPSSDNMKKIESIIQNYTIPGVN